MRPLMNVRLNWHSIALLLAAVLFVTAAHAQWTPMNPVRKAQQEADGVVFSMGTGTLKVQVCSESLIHVFYSPTAAFPKRTNYVVIKETWPATKWTMQSTDDAVTLSTSLLKVTITRKDGAISYADAKGEALVTEASRRLSPEKVNGEDTYRAESFINIYGSHEALYGLGQHQAAYGIIAVSRWTSRRTTATSLCRSCFRARAMASFGITPRAAASITGLRITSTSVRKSLTSSTTTSSTGRSSTTSSRNIAT